MPSFAFKLPLLIFAAVSAFAQTTPSPSTLAFDVASVRPSKPGAPQHSNIPLDSGNVYGSISPDDARSAAGGLLIVTHQALWRYISFAYKHSGTQELALRFNFYSGVPKSGAPFWVTGSFDSPAEFFDISARAPADTSIDQMRLMMQSLLADRFHLVIHYISADAPVFALVLAKPGVTGPNLQPHPPSDVCANPAPSQSSAPAPFPAATSVVGDLPPVCGVIAHGLAYSENSEEVRLELSFRRFDGGVFNRASRREARIVDDGVQAGRLTQDPIDTCSDRDLVVDVNGQHFYATTRC